MSTINPTITIIIPCYNQGPYLAEAVRSLVAQTYPHWDCVVVNDGSTDDTRAAAQALGPTVRYLEKPNGGPAEARNVGIAAATGDFLLFLDADDLLLPTALATLVAAAEVPPDAAVVYGATEEIDEAGHILRTWREAAAGNDMFHRLLDGNIAPIHAFLLRRTEVAAAGGFDSALRAHEDWDLMVRLAGRGLPFVSTPTPVAVYRRHANSNSCNGRRMLQTALAVLDKASGQHHNCAECRTRIRRARRAFRLLFVRDTLWAELRSRPGPAKLWNMVRFVAAAQWRDMAFLPMLLWLASKKGWRTITGRG